MFNIVATESTRTVANDEMERRRGWEWVTIVRRTITKKVTTFEVKRVTRSVTAPGDTKVSAQTPLTIRHRRSQGVQWVDLHPQAGEKLGVISREKF